MTVCVCLSLSQTNHCQMGSKVRSALISALYYKSLNLQQQSKTDSSVVNLISSDVERIFQLLFMAQFMWTPVVMISATIYFLWQLLGPSALVGTGSMLTLVLSQRFVTKRIGRNRRLMAKTSDTRVQLMTEILGGIRVLKLYGWEEVLLEKLLAVRATEMGCLGKILYFRALSVAVMFFTPTISAAMMFSCYTLTGGNFTVPIVMASYAFLVMVRPVIYNIPNVISNFAESVIAFRRISQFLQLPEVQETSLKSSSKTDMDSEVNSPFSVPKGAISIVDGEFSWDGPTLQPNQTPDLRDINLQIKSGELVVIIGEVGSGKSSLLNAMLGEMPRVSGHVELFGAISLCAQDPWLQHASLRDNVTFVSMFDPIWYQKVIEVCQLKPDLKQLPQGDLTEIGERGVTLSGGQKARVALARAVYRATEVDIFLMDDVLSAVDAHVGQALVDRCLLGVLNSKTRILTANSAPPVLLHSADKVVVVKDGRIVACSKWDDLPHNLKPSAWVSPSPSSSAGKKVEKEKEPENVEGPGSPISPESPSAGDADPLHSEENSGSGKVGIRMVMEYFGIAHGNSIFTTLTVLGLVLFAEVFRLSCDVWLSYWAESVQKTGNTEDPTLDYFYIVIYLVLGGLLIFGAAVRSLWFVQVTRSIATKLHDSLARHVLRAPTTTFFDVTPVGRLLNYFAKDIDAVDSQLPDVLQMLLMNTFFVCGTLFVCAAASPFYILCLGPLLWYFLDVKAYYTKTSRTLKIMESKSRTPIYSIFDETIRGIAHVRSMGASLKFLENFQKKVDQNTALLFGTYILTPWVLLRINAICTCIIFAVAFTAVASANAGANVAFVGLGISYAMQLLGQVFLLVRFSVEVENQFTSFDRLQLLGTVPQEKQTILTSPETSSVSSNWPSQGCIEFERVTAGYKVNMMVIKDLSCVISPGQKIGICGRTGSGKTTLTNLLFRLIHPAKGRILIDGVDISWVPLDVLRRSISIIPQDPLLFKDTIRYNVDPEGKYTDAAIWTALQNAMLYEKVRELPEGLDYPVSADGRNFSVGQRQLLCLVRVLLRNSKVVLFDEATSNIDSATDDLIQQTIGSHFHESTLLMIAHRLHTIANADKILVMDRGNLAEFDSPSELKKRKGIFWELLQSTS